MANLCHHRHIGYVDNHYVGKDGGKDSSGVANESGLANEYGLHIRVERLLPSRPPRHTIGIMVRWDYVDRVVRGTRR